MFNLFRENRFLWQDMPDSEPEVVGVDNQAEEAPSEEDQTWNGLDEAIRNPEEDPMTALEIAIDSDHGDNSVDFSLNRPITMGDLQYILPRLRNDTLLFGISADEYALTITRPDGGQRTVSFSQLDSQNPEGLYRAELPVGTSIRMTGLSVQRERDYELAEIGRDAIGQGMVSDEAERMVFTEEDVDRADTRYENANRARLAATQSDRAEVARARMAERRREIASREDTPDYNPQGIQTQEERERLARREEATALDSYEGPEAEVAENTPSPERQIPSRERPSERLAIARAEELAQTAAEAEANGDLDAAISAYNEAAQIYTANGEGDLAEQMLDNRYRVEDLQTYRRASEGTALNGMFDS